MATKAVRTSHFLAVSAAVAVALSSAPASAGPREQAKQIHDRLTGVPPTAAVLDSMTAKVTAGDAVGAAMDAMNNPAFYNTTLRNFVTPWTNETQTAFADLNDYTATVIGMIRDNMPFNQVLSEDIVYVGAAGVVDPAYAQTNNDHYIALESERVDLSNPTLLVRRTQSGLPDSQLQPNDTAGVMTTRAFGEAFIKAGTNRRAWRFVSMNFLCRDLEPMNDITRPADRIRQDISRSPGGDSSLYLNNCVGCHAGMDPLSGAFAYYEFDEEVGRVIYTPDSVQGKYLINASTFPQGYVTVDDSWINYWRAGPNAVLGWRGPNDRGNGAKTLGMEVTASRAFSECQVEQVFTKICLHPPATPQDRAEVQRIATVFEGNNYNMKRVFAETAAYCKGQ